MKHVKRAAWLELGLFIAIIAFATFLRVYRLDQLPPGLHYDEAFKGVEARKIITGAERPIFYSENLTEEPMRIYGTALTFVLFGDSPWSLRLVSAIAGILNVAALYLLARVLFRSRSMAALAAFVLTILYWHVNFSRLGMEPILTPLTMTLSFGFLWRALTPIPSRMGDGRRSPERSGGEGGAQRWRRSWDWGLAGVFMGATQYTYKAALFVPFLAAAFIGLEIVLDREFWTLNRRGLVIFALTAVLVFAPLGLYFVAHPGEFIERPSTVSIASSGLEPLADNVVKVAGMFFIRGDDNPRSNLPGRPALDPFLAVGFVIGLIVALAQIRKRESRFVWLWLGVMALPSALTDFAPHFGRDIGLPPVIALIVASGLAALVGKIPAPRWILAAVLLGGLATSTYSSVNDYFSVWGARTGLFDSFDAGYLALAQKLSSRPADELVFISPVAQDYFTIQYGLAGRPASSFDGRDVLVLAPAGAPATYGIVLREDARSLARLKRFYPAGSAVDTVYDFLGQPYATLFRAQGTPKISPQKTLNARLGGAIELIGYDVARNASPDAITLTVYWGSLAALDKDYTVFVHLLGAMNPTTQSPVWAQDDARPGRGSFPTPNWQAGEVVVDEYRLAVPADIAPGNYQIELGMYSFETGARIRMVDANGAPMENDRVLFETISLP